MPETPFFLWTDFFRRSIRTLQRSPRVLPAGWPQSTDRQHMYLMLAHRYILNILLLGRFIYIWASTHGRQTLRLRKQLLFPLRPVGTSKVFLAGGVAFNHHLASTWTTLQNTRSTGLTPWPTRTWQSTMYFTLNSAHAILVLGHAVTPKSPESI